MGASSVNPAAVPKLLNACQAVVERWEHGDLAEAACMCAEAVNMAFGLQDDTPDGREQARNEKTQAYALQIDGPLLAKQRQWLLDLIEKTTGDGQDHLEGVMALLDEIADQAHDRHGIDSLIEAEEMEPHNQYVCECERPGYFWSGVPGILAHLENGRLPAGAKAERCGLCCRYPSDAAALEKLQELGDA
jgi:hypothetical protein